MSSRRTRRPGHPHGSQHRPRWSPALPSTSYGGTCGFACGMMHSSSVLPAHWGLLTRECTHIRTQISLHSVTFTDRTRSSGSTTPPPPRPIDIIRSVRQWPYPTTSFLFSSGISSASLMHGLWMDDLRRPPLWENLRISPCETFPIVTFHVLFKHDIIPPTNFSYLMCSVLSSMSLQSLSCRSYHLLCRCILYSLLSIANSMLVRSSPYESGRRPCLSLMYREKVNLK
jgi:hypothetical protein